MLNKYEVVGDPELSMFFCVLSDKVIFTEVHVVDRGQSVCCSLILAGMMAR